MKNPLKRCLIFALQRLFLLFARKELMTLPAQGVMVIAPHADDETLACGALIARAREQNVPVRLVFVTDGGGSPAHDPSMEKSELIALRRREAQTAAKTLGVLPEMLIFLGFEDAGFDREESLDPLALRQALANQIWLHHPALIFSPYGNDAHAAHRAIAAAVEALFREKKMSAEIYEYPMWYWPRRAGQDILNPSVRAALVKVPACPYVPLKRQALRAYGSQFGAGGEAQSKGHLPDGFAAQNLMPYELFFRKSL